MRKSFFQVLALVVMSGSMVAFGQQATVSFTGTFVDQASGVSMSFQQAPDGSLSGMVTSSGGQYQVQGQADQNYAYGAFQSQQGVLGFQAQLSPDGQMMQLQFYQMGANGQPTGQGQQMVLQRQSGGQVGGGGAGYPAPPPGAVPVTPGYGTQPTMPTQPGFGGQPVVPTQPGFGGQPVVPTQPGFGGQPSMPTQPGLGGQQAGGDWTGTFSGNNGAFVLSLQAAQGGYVGYIQDQGQRYQFQAHVEQDGTVHGQGTANGGPFEVWIYVNGGTPMLDVGDTTYYLQRTSNQPTP